MPKLVRRGDVVLVAFPFTDLTATKVRPAVVVSPDSSHRATPDALLAAVSSVVPSRRLLPSELLLSDRDRGFAVSGLKRSSLVLCGKLFTMEQRLLLRWLGRLDQGSLARLDKALAAAVGLGRWG
jgi:mRNA interferase MazF